MHLHIIPALQESEANAMTGQTNENRTGAALGLGRGRSAQKSLSVFQSILQIQNFALCTFIPAYLPSFIPTDRPSFRVAKQASKKAMRIKVTIKKKKMEGNKIWNRYLLLSFVHNRRK